MELRIFQRQLAQRLLAWSGFSVVCGVVLWLTRRPFWRGVGSQAVGWGMIDAGIALFGQHANTQKARDPEANTPDALAQEAASLHRLLWINTGLDVLYMLGGLRLARHEQERWHGHGWGIVIQGAFLFVFDLLHAREVPPGNVQAAAAKDENREADGTAA